MSIVVWYFVLVNIVALCLYGIDKRRAKRKKHRISEKTLLIVALIGGAVGALLGMQMFRHKTKKAKFYLGIPVILILQIAIALYVNYYW